MGYRAHARILVATTSEQLRFRIKDLLSNQGIRVSFAANLIETTRKAKKQKPLLVILEGEWVNESICLELRNLVGPHAFLTIIGNGHSEEADHVLSPEFNDLEFDRCLRAARRVLRLESTLAKQRSEQQLQTNALNHMNQNLIQASRRFEELFSALPIACFTIDSCGLIHEWNRQAERTFRIPNHAAFLQPVWSILNDELWNEEFVRAAFSVQALEDVDWSTVLLSGEQKHLVTHVYALYGQSGDRVGAICTNLDVTERKNAEKRIDDQIVTINRFAKELQAEKAKLEQANRRLEQLAVTDVMTGLLNHRGFQEELARAGDRQCRLGLPLSLILMDVDHFKEYNDRFGHQAGDDILAMIGNVLLSVTRSSEPAARYGGEEFAILLEGVDSEAALNAAERIRLAIQGRSWPHRAITASFGVATMHGAAIDRKELIRQADVALYRSKRSGRDRTSHFHAFDRLSVA